MSDLSTALEATAARLDAVRAIADSCTIVEAPTRTGYVLDVEETSRILRRHGVGDGLEMTAALKVAQARVDEHNERITPKLRVRGVRL